MEFRKGSEKTIIDFLSDLTEKDKVAIIAHEDMDGFVSALILEKIIGKFDFLDFSNYKKDFFKEKIKEFKSKKINKLIIADLCVDQESENLKQIEKFAEILIIDHHKWDNFPDSKKTSFVLTQTNFSASNLVYSACSKMQDLSSIDFLAAIAIILDYGFKDKSNIDFINQIAKKYNLKQNENIWESDLGKLAREFSYASIYFQPDSWKVYSNLKKVKSLSDFKNLEKYSNPIKEEINKVIADFNKNKEVYSWGYFYSFHKKYGTGSPIATLLSEKEPEKLFLTVSNSLPEKDTVSLNARCQAQKFDCSDILRKATESIPNSTAGGHIPASGGKIPKPFFNIFKQNLLKILGK